MSSSRAKEAVCLSLWFEYNYNSFFFIFLIHFLFFMPYKMSRPMRYDINVSFEQNKKEGPYYWHQINDKNALIEETLGEYGIETDFFWYTTKLPLWVAAWPLFNEKYMQAAAMDGFSVITRKTFRSVERRAHRNDGSFLWHNVVYLDKDQPLEIGDMWWTLHGTLENMHDDAHTTITNSFGMGSDVPEVWMPQVTAIESWMNEKKKQTIASVVASPADWWTLEQLAEDYTQTALKAESAWARIVEFNLSCQNVCSSEWSIYTSPETTMFICKYAKEHLSPDTKLLIKIWYNDKAWYKLLVEPVLPYIDWIVAINTIPMNVVDDEEKQALPGWLRTWTCWYAIGNLAAQAVWFLHELRKENNRTFKLLWCGWVMSPEAFMAHIDAWADFVLCGTAAWFNPELPVQVAEHIRDNKIQLKIG